MDTAKMVMPMTGFSVLRRIPTYTELAALNT